MSKRARDIDVADDNHNGPSSSTSPPPRPLKRRHAAASSPIRQINPTLTTIFTSTPAPAGYYSTPYTVPRTRTPFSVPLDSPSNPFGLRRSLVALELPRTTSYSKHLALRLQLVIDSNNDPAIYSQRRHRGGVYRIVQIPANYTFRLLHKLILFLFASDINQYHGSKPPFGSGQSQRVGTRSARKPDSASSANTKSSTVKGKGKARPDAATTPVMMAGESSTGAWGGHFFEVVNDIALLSEAKAPGVIKAGSGKTRVKLSSVRERRLFRDLYDTRSDMTTTELPSTLEDEDLDQEDWTWEAEDDFTLGHVWPSGPALEDGIIYRHSPSVAIHITANTTLIPSRKGRDNIPFVFMAQGVAGSALKVAHTIPNADGYEDTSKLDISLDGPTPFALGSSYLDHWNRSEAFQKFLKREVERERALRLQNESPRSEHDDDDDDDCFEPIGRVLIPSSDGLTPETDTDPELSFLMSADESDCASIYSMHSAHSDSYLFPLVTPYPANPLHRKRVERVQKRMARLTRSGMKDVMSSDSEDEKKKKRLKKNKEEKKSKPKETKDVQKAIGKGKSKMAPLLLAVGHQEDDEDEDAEFDGYDEGEYDGDVPSSDDVWHPYWEEREV